jgi:hypothetical protein
MDSFRENISASNAPIYKEEKAEFLIAISFLSFSEIPAPISSCFYLLTSPLLAKEHFLNTIMVVVADFQAPSISPEGNFFEVKNTYLYKQLFITIILFEILLIYFIE